MPSLAPIYDCKAFLMVLRNWYDLVFADQYYSDLAWCFWIDLGIGASESFVTIGDYTGERFRLELILTVDIQ